MLKYTKQIARQIWLFCIMGIKRATSYLGEAYNNGIITAYGTNTISR